ncbi:VWA domain-containing protein [Rosettibacter firmus]|uniref:VWA domain-containing protein n=1 Tax=Rosettibacter firmus TaxID=3111522 RepID=UPI00336C2040
MLRLIKKNIPIIFILMLVQCTFESTPPTETESETQVNKSIPGNPKPVDKSVDQPLVITLQWESTGAIKYDVYLDKVNPPRILIANDISTKTLVVTNLDYNTTYYWKVIAKFDDGTKVEGPIWSFTTLKQSYPTLNGYAMNLYKVETQLPSYVHVMFQVVDLNGKGVSTLTQNDFEVLEDGEPISQTESQLEIRKREAVPYKLKTVLMLDNSTSLQNNLDDIRNAARSFIDKIVPQQEVTIYQFSDHPEVLSEFTDNKDSLMNALQRYQLGYATTNLYGAIIKGASLWNDKFSIDEIIQGMMIIFTDGRDTQGSNTLAEALNAIHNKIVFTIGLGNEIQPEILRAIGNAGFYTITNINELENQFTKIQESIISYANSFYVLTYKSPKRGNNNHILTIRIKNNPYTGERSEITGSFNSNNFSSF